MFAASHEVQFVDEKAVAARVRHMQHELERGDIRHDRRPRIEEPFAGSNGPAFEDQALRCRRDVSHWDAEPTEVSSKAIALLHCSPFGAVDLFHSRVSFLSNGKVFTTESAKNGRSMKQRG